MTINPIFNRTERLLGAQKLKLLQDTHIIIFGVGGVGSWCAESLIRTGVGHLTIVDNDEVCITNINRQLMATTKTIGKPKVEVLKERLLEINPNADIQALQIFYNAENADNFHLHDYDYVVDAIDSLQEKAHLMLHATELGKPLFCSMGAALRMDPTKVCVSEFWKIQGDPLARAIRNKFKRQHLFPKHKIQCVWSQEPAMPNIGDTFETSARKAVINGSLSHITAIFGMTIAGLIISRIVEKQKD